jgi:hypothetical protein
MPRSRKRHSAQRGPAALSAPPIRTDIGWLLGFAFVAVNLLLAGYFLDSVPSPNPTSRALPVLTLYEEGRYAIDTYEKFTMDKSFVNGHYYSDKAPLTTWIVLPFYGALKLLHVREPAADKVRWLTALLLGDLICGTIPFVVLVWLVFRALTRETSPKTAVLLSMLPLYGSFVFAYAGVFMSHVLAGALLVGSYIFLQRRTHPTLCGLLLGLAVLAEFPTVLALPIWIVAILRPAGVASPRSGTDSRRRELVRFLLGGIPCAVALLWYNHAITGSFAKMPYDYEVETAFSEMRSGYGIGLPQPSALWGLLFSTYRGMFFYAPALIIVAFSYLLTRGPKVFRDVASAPLGLLAIAYLLLISSYFVWWGGWAYGPRHLIPLAMLLFYEGLPMLARTRGYRGWIYSASVVGLGMVWIAKSTALYIMPEQFSNPVFDIAVPAFLNRQLRHDALPTMLFGTDPWVASWIWIGLFVLGVVGLCALAAATPGRRSLKH